MFTTENSNYTLHRNVIDIWLCRADELQSKADDFYTALCVEEIRRAERFKFETHKKRFIIFHAFMRKVLAKYLTIDAEQLHYIKGEKGKPYVSLNPDSTLADEIPLLQFNLSHSRDIALLAVTQKGELGVDIECIDRNTDWQGIAKRFFTFSEQASIFALPEQQQHLAFYELWTRKEAYMKVLGSGLSLSPTGFSLTVPPEKPAVIQHHSNKYRTGQLINFEQIILPDTLNNYFSTIASESPIQNINYYQFNLT